MIKTRGNSLAERVYRQIKNYLEKYKKLLVNLKTDTEPNIIVIKLQAYKF